MKPIKQTGATSTSTAPLGWHRPSATADEKATTLPLRIVLKEGAIRYSGGSPRDKPTTTQPPQRRQVHTAGQESRGDCHQRIPVESYADPPQIVLKEGAIRYSGEATATHPPRPQVVSGHAS
jgi:hypothetical protein